ncbi:MAG: hypothetical protein PF637_12915 [Spirochaetes bacterium]|nr:hypothetical protein [Spirochaetota bacterium]
MGFFMDLLRYMDSLLNGAIRGLMEGYSVTALSLLFAVSFAYGIVHSIGPGHGKALVVSFFLKEDHPWRKSIFLAALISLIHTGTALILAYLFHFVLTSVRGMFKIQLQGYFMVVSGIMVVVTGTFFLLFKMLHKHKKDDLRNSNRNVILIGISAGIVPCPAALMIMMITLSNGIALAGLMSVVAISLGMFVLLSVVGSVAIKSRSGMLFLSDKASNRTEIVSTIVEYASIVLIISIGLVMALKILV